MKADIGKIAYTFKNLGIESYNVYNNQLKKVIVLIFGITIG